MRNVIITGGSRGLGLGIVRRLAVAGYNVIAIGRHEHPGLSAVIQESEKSGRKSIRFVSCDLAEIDKIQNVIKDLREQVGRVYGLVNNAGVSFDGPLATMPLERMEEMVRVNTLSPMVVTKAVVRSMMADGEGRIINIASVMAFTGYSGLAVYGATKAAIVGFTRSLAREVGRCGINVNAVAPGFVATDMTHSVSGEQLEQIRRRSALKRLPEIDDVASTVEFLFSDGAKNITGTVITVDAGNSA